MPDHRARGARPVQEGRHGPQPPGAGVHPPARQARRATTCSSDWIPLDGADARQASGWSPTRAPRIDAAAGLRHRQERPPDPQRRPRARPSASATAGSSWSRKDINLRVKARALNLRGRGLRDRQGQGPRPPLHRQERARDRRSGGLHRPALPRGSRSRSEALAVTEPPPANHYFILQERARTRRSPASTRARGRSSGWSRRPAYGIAPRNAEQTFALHAVLNPAVPLVTPLRHGRHRQDPARPGRRAGAAARSSARSTSRGRSCRCRTRTSATCRATSARRSTPTCSRCGTTWAIIKNQFDERRPRVQADRRDGRDREAPHRAARLHPRPQLLEHHLHRRRGAEPDAARGARPSSPAPARAPRSSSPATSSRSTRPTSTPSSNGLSYLIDRIKGNPLYAHVNLDKGERSELANLASMLL